MRTRPALRAFATLLALSLAVSGCASLPVTNAEDSGQPSASEGANFKFYPGGSASRNLDVFRNILEVNGAGTQSFDLRAAVSELVDTGFDIDSITHTAAKTNTGEIADSVTLAISFKGECLIGQFSKSWLTVTTAAPTASGCLIGDVEQAKLD